MKNTLFTILALFIINYSTAQPNGFPGEEDSYILLKNANIIDVITDTPKQGSILIKNDRIEAINYSEKFTPPAGTIEYDVNGKYIIPGLIDGHVHITHGTLKEAAESLEIALKSGITGVRDMGGDGRMLTLLKRNNQIGEYDGPDVFFSTIIAGPSFFKDDPRPQSVALGARAGEVSWQRAITPDTDFKQIIAEVKGIGATAIKIYANVDKDLMKMVCDEASNQGLEIWAHAAIPPTRPSEVSTAGVKTMSHAGDLIQYELAEELIDRHAFESRKAAQDYREKLKQIKWDNSSPKVKSLLKLMKSNNNILDATLFVYYHGITDPARTQYFKDNNIPIDSFRFKTAMEFTKVAYKNGIKIGAGSDSMIAEDHQTINLHKELELLVEAGLSPIDALRAATIINAEVVGQEKHIGSIEAGKLANLVILDNNPLQDIRNTTSIRYIIKRGAVISSR